MNQWQQYQVKTEMPLHRQGWRGVYDAIVAAVTRAPRITVQTPVTLSFWAKGSTPAIAINGVSLEAQRVGVDADQYACRRFYEKLNG